MKRNIEEILTTLKFELEFRKANGYGMSMRSPWREPSLFLDSPTCLNFSASGIRPCNECELHDFVPKEHCTKTVPCHHIPLNEAGDTVDKLEWEADERGIERAVENWLIDTIRKLEERQSSQSGNILPPVTKAAL